MKVRAYLLMTAAAILVPIVIFSAVALQMLLESERRAALRSLEETARATALLVDRELSSAESALRVLALSPHLASGDMVRFYAHAKTADRGNGGRTILFAPNGQQIINTVVPRGTPLPPPPGVTKRTRQVIRTQRTVVSGVILGAVQRVPVTTINIPVPIGGGRQYVLGSVFDSAYFQRLVAQRPLPAHWTVTVMDSAGLQVARSGSTIEAVGQPASAQLVQVAQTAEHEEIRRFTVDGVPFYGAFTQSALADWTVAVTAPAATVQAAAQRAVQVAAVGLLAAIALAAAAAALFGRRLGRSMRHAVASAEALGRGQVPATSTETGIREVDELNRALKEASTLLAQSEAERLKLLRDEQQARRTAERQNREKDDFLAMLGHELRNPLSAIVAATDLMEMQDVAADRVDSARAILRRQSEHLARIVDDLLDLTRLSKGKIALDLRRLDLAAAVGAAVDATRAADGGRHTIILDAKPVWIDADRTRLDQIINNLLTNAVKFTPAGGRIDVQVAQRGEDAVLAVRDTGVGIAPELMPRLFDVFVQGTVSIDRSQGGLGIGLSLVRELVALHGGSVRVESPGPGQGSSFFVCFPCADSRARDDDGLPDPAAAEPRRLPGTSSVLLVEDNRDARQMMAAKLAVQGYAVLEAATGDEGLRIAREEKPDVAIVDVGLPGLDGYAVANHLRACKETREMVLIALTGYGQPADRERALRAGFDEHLVKPAHVERVIEAIAQCRRAAES